MTTSRRLLGQRGEDAAARWYEANGYSVVDRNWRSGRTGEIDLVVARSGVLVFCEVKTRTSDRFGMPVEAVTPAKQMRLRRLGAQWLAAHPSQRGREIRFDVASVMGTTVEILEGVL